ncbi:MULTISPECIES: type I polyketide synthase [unclassified Corallococcus]|uniref:type I polyketide synthase n=1 Tax=unclassified Corallococcus TaxID=2685029 RepID=UPI001A8F5FD0|nr:MULTISPECIES: type I polyketide synthase [unclassified Corallococcus]MBN9683666.1 acyltransferase domain-containing protein [Corallococcus sp. NCSPR001]WAS84823.1 beta-ketoacyl synthase N-terminal-like domain-containing protein [Corallococcus sp. NCRR]
MSDAVGGGEERIAIVGLSGRFPGAQTLEGFWEMLRRGGDARRVPTDAELDDAGVPQALRAHPQWVRSSYVLEDATEFDAGLFGYSPREAELMDPQQRIFMECAWESLDNAGYDPGRFKGAVAVYASVSLSSYLLRALMRQPDLMDAAGSFGVMLANDKDYVATRVSHRLGLRGPSATVQTACSSSLVALHLACQSLLSGESDMALAGGSSVSFPQTAGYLYQEGMIFSPDGYCRAFDAKANGTVRGAGAAVVVLKRLSDALKDGDTIHGVLLGTAVNNDGAGKVGFTAPSVEGQAAVIAEALAISGVTPDDIQYVEAHATGTPLGDPIEVAALNQAFGGKETGQKRVALGSLKAAIGHLDAAAGIAGVVKTVLAMEHGEIPASPHFEKPNPVIDFDAGPFFVPSQPRPWTSPNGPRRAGVSAFGIGGTNTHVILEEAPKAAAPAPSKRAWHVLPLSARTPAALDAATEQLASHLDANPNVSLSDVAYTLQVGRHAHEHRRAVVVKDVADAKAALRDARRLLGGSGTNTRRPVVFLFSGQGSQYVDMGRGLYEQEPAFRAEVDACAEKLKAHLGLDLRTVLYPPADGREKATEQLKQTSLTQPALFVIEYALAKLWASWGVTPQAMVGHSIGEYVAACLSGVFSLDDALALVATRGRLMQSLPSGSMLSVRMTPEALAPLMDARISVAAVNAPGFTVVAGPTDAVDALQAKLEAQKVEVSRLHTSHAFHSQMMDPIVEEFRQAVAKVARKEPKDLYLSNVTGTWVTREDAVSPAYWARHLRDAVRFQDSATLLLNDPEHVFLEVGPGNALATLVRRNAQEGTFPSILTTLPAPRDAQQDALAHAADAFAKLWLAGAKTIAGRVYKGESRRRIPLPAYPFQRERYDLLKGPPPALPRTAATRPATTQGVELTVPAWPRTRASPQVPSLSGQRWLVLEADTPVAARVSERLRQAGADVVSLVAGQGASDPVTKRFAVDPSSPDALGEHLERLSAEDWTPAHIAYLWPLVKEPRDLESGLAASFHGLLALGKAVGPGAAKTPVTLDVVTTGAQDVTGEEPLLPWQAAAVGASRVLPQEYPGLTVRAVDVTWPAPDESASGPWLERLVTELATGEDPVVALRGPYRHVEAFETLDTPAPTEQAGLKDGGVYVIVGGLGRVGLALAEQLTQAVKPKLVLLSRRTLPAPGEWDAWRAGHDAQDATSRAIDRMRALERSGAQVLALRADAGVPGQLDKALQVAEAKFGRIDGVFYAAGDGGMATRISVAEATPEATTPLLSGRFGGLTQLAEALASRQPDFVVVQSSLTVVLGGMAVSAVAAAHAGMDAVAARQARQGGTRWYTVDWDVWGVGEGFRPDAVIPPAEGFRLLRALLTQPTGGRFLASLGSLEARRQVARDGASTSRAGGSGSGKHPRPPLANAFVAPRDETEEKVAALWQDLLGVESVGITDNFFELGGHSLLGVQLLSRIREAFQVELSMRALFESPTVEVMTVAIVEASASQLDPEALEAMLAELEQS